MGDANHDVFFRRVFGRPDLAADLWRRLLPPALLGALDVERAERVDGDAVDDALRSRRADLIFRVPLRGSPDRFAFVFLLIEHQSTPDPLMPFRVLVYGVQALSDFIEQYRAEHGRSPTRLPAIIPLVVYQGEPPFSWSNPTSRRGSSRNARTSTGWL